MRVSLRTSLSPDECADALRAAIDPARFLKVFDTLSGASKPVIGSASAQRFTLVRRRRYRCSFAPVFYATLTRAPSGTVIAGTITLARPVAAMIALSAGATLLSPLACAAALGIMTIAGAAAQAEWTTSVWDGTGPFFLTFIPAGLATVAVAVVGRRLCRQDDEQFLTAFVVQQLHAEVVDAGQAAHRCVDKSS
jgi:hypothetical protein